MGATRYFPESVFCPVTGQGIRADVVQDAWIEHTPLGVFPVACPCGETHDVEATETVSFRLETS